MSRTLKLEKDRHIALVTISNPPANTWTHDSLIELEALVEALEADTDITALVITGDGDKFFSAGADLKTFADGDKGMAATMAVRFGHAFERLANYRGVSIAAINGYAMGGGLECALACDVRIVERQSRLALPEARVGLLPCGCGTQHLTRLVGEGWAKRMILCGEQVDADTAERIGLVEEVVDTGKALERAMAMAEGVARQSPAALEHCKTLIMSSRERGMSDGFRLERELFVNLFDDPNQREGVNAFLEKREPQWTPVNRER
ncbi:enoyl-CoA hydratase/carnithine racemase [Modicisalibacter xianhensis]|uniref:Enoyl-CoA hydratase/carnithine racemase n=1 Tax=Modicisalibacter xianhensis TaxID=442341 RepID=A0A4R8FVR0_9GAMM|nr:enoyl-CoA hydratase [Halomonas xianhensis]TDX30924.1 enoyl-CoA hydratase/carnithine racemase [Halomonas xianhensis]